MDGKYKLMPSLGNLVCGRWSVAHCGVSCISLFMSHVSARYYRNCNNDSV